jgi:hypothetical protein
MDPELFNLYLQAMSGQKDASSAAFDPVLAFMTGQYQPKAQFNEEQLFGKLAPMITYAGQEGAGPRFEAAAAIRGGRAPWDIKKDKRLRGDMDEDEWKDLVDDMFKENEKVKGKLLDLEMQQDVFQKQGLPGYADRYKPEDMYKFAPKAFGKLLEGLPEAQTAEDAALRKISGKYDSPVMLTSDQDRIKFLEKKARDERASYDKGRNKDSILSSIGHLLNIGSPSAKNANFEGIAKEQVRKMGSKPILDEGATAKNQAYGEYVKSLVRRKTGSASGKLGSAEKLAGQIQTELESKGRSPLYDAILRQAAMGGKLK